MLYQISLSDDVGRDLQKPSCVRCKVTLNIANSRARFCDPELKCLVDLLLSQLDPRIDRVADLVQESLGGVRCLDVAESSLLEKTRAGSRKAILGDTVGAEMGTKPSIGPGEVSS